LATGAIYSFTGFPGIPECHLHLDHDGYPTGAAWRLAEAQRLSADASGFALAFLGGQQRAEPLASPGQAADALYHYRVRFLAGADPALVVQCWRRLPGAAGWTARLQPLALHDFIGRFLPSAP
jgi:hypothetical protein